MLKLWKPTPPNHDDIFLERYQLLRAWSLKITGSDRQLAEDLLHDTFVQFTLTRPDLESIRDLDSYLYAMLRNSHVSHLRRALNVRTTLLSMVDFDSLEVGLRVTEVQDQIKVQDELRLICHYALLRKDTSKGASVLILRFFHGYYPSEIVQVLRSNWVAVTKWLQRARNEAALYVEDPSALSFIRNAPEHRPPKLGFARSTEDLIGELREMIFLARRDSCLSQKTLRELYRNAEGQAIDQATTAHLVSCAECLDTVNRMLGLPLLNERYPTDMTGRDRKGSGGGPTPPAGADKEQAVRSLRRMKETFEHRPKELRIAVNGFLQVSQKVSSERMEQTLSLDLEEKPDFVEVFSEQWIRLLLLDVQAPPDGAFEQHRRVELSEGRILAVTIKFSGPCPDLHVVYEDPTQLQLQGSTLADEERQFHDDALNPVGVENSRMRSSGLWSNLRRDWTRIAGIMDVGSLLRPASVTALLALVLIAVMFFYPSVSPGRLSAKELLQRSTIADQNIATIASQVVHRTINLEERRFGQDQAVLSRRRIELWLSGAQQLAALRVYDEKNQLVSGKWSRGPAARVLLHHGSGLVSSIDSRPSASSLAFSDTWQLLPSAQVFAQLIEDSDRVTVAETATEYTVNYERGVSSQVDGLQRATLVLNRPELRAIKQTLLIKQGAELREYIFGESSFEQRPLNAVAPAVFEPDAELLSGTESRIKRATENVAASSRLPVSASPLVTAAQEVEVVRQLNQANAFLGEQISVERTAEGQLQVKGIVDNEERKNELLQALSAFKANPAVRIEIATVAEAVRRQKQSPSGALTITKVDGNKGEIPVESELRQYFSKRGVPAEQLDGEIQRYSARLLDRSFQARRHALAMKQIAERFSLDDLRALDPQARANWRAMIVQHARALRQEVASLRKGLESVFPPLASGSEGPVDVASDEGLVHATQQLFALAVSSDDDMHSTFSIYAGRRESVPLKTKQFWQLLGSTENLAASIGGQ
jgi:DNA-directed RNA polymerase specialized sigma24 family protein